MEIINGNLGAARHAGPVLPSARDRQRAIFCSYQAYENRAWQRVPSIDLGFREVLKGKKSSKSLVLAIAGDDDGTRTLFVAFPGSQTPDDWLLDADIRQRYLSQTGMGFFGNCVPGVFHAGFHQKLLEIIPDIAEIQEFAKIKEINRLVFCGHSLGGAQAHLALIKFADRFNLRVNEDFHHMSIGFGSPCFCDAQAASYLTENGFANRMFTYVRGNDPVPRILLTSFSTARAAACTFALRNLCRRLINPAQLCADYVAARHVDKAPIINPSAESGALPFPCSCLWQAGGRILSGIACLPHVLLPVPGYAPVGQFMDCPANSEPTTITHTWLKNYPVHRLSTADFQDHKIGGYFQSMFLGVDMQAIAVPRINSYVTPRVDSATLVFKGKHDPPEQRQVHILVRGRDLYLPFKCSVVEAGSLLSCCSRLSNLQWSTHVASRDSSTIVLKLEDALLGPAVTNLFDRISNCFIRITTRFGETQKYEFKVQPPCFDSYMECNLSSSIAILLVLQECGIERTALQQAKSELRRLVEEHHDQEVSTGFSEFDERPNPPLSNGLHQKLINMKINVVDPIITKLTESACYQGSATRTISYRRTLQLLAGCVHQPQDPMLILPACDLENRVYRHLNIDQRTLQELFDYDINKEPSLMQVPAFMRRLPRAVQKPILQRARMIYSVKKANELIRSVNDVKIVMFVGDDFSGKTELIKCLAVPEEEESGRIASGYVQCYRMASTAADAGSGEHDATAALLRIPGRINAAVTTEDIHTEWPDLEHVPDLCVVVVSYSGDTMEAAQRWTKHARRLSRRTRDQEFVMVVTGMDRVLHGNGGARVWTDLSPDEVANDRRELASRAGIPIKSVYLAVAVHSGRDSLGSDTMDNLKDRGVVFRPEITKILRSKILNLKKPAHAH